MHRSNARECTPTWFYDVIRSAMASGLGTNKALVPS